MNFSFSPLGDQAIVIELGHDINEQTEQQVRKVAALLESRHPQWMTEYVPAFVTVAVFYDPCLAAYDRVKGELESLLAHLGADIPAEARLIEIPVCYGGEFGPDLAFVAQHNKLTPRQVIDIHTTGTYSVHMIGFAPGFPFIGGMSEKIATPRRNSPRVRIPERTVGIAGMQTGVYPIETPGGWQLIGRTPLRLFRPEDSIPTLLRAGDKVVFKEISEDDYDAWEEEADAENA